MDDREPPTARRYEQLPPPTPLTLPRGPLPKAPPPFVIRVAMKLRTFFQRCADAVVPGEIAVFDRAWGTAITAMVGAATRHGVADVIGDDALTAAQIGARTGMDADVGGGRLVLERAELVAGSFFDADLPRDCDAYSLKNVLHDWDDYACACILRNLRRAMAPGARLLVMDVVTETNVGEGFGPLLDVHMLVACSGGRERGVEEFRRLLGATGFRLERVHPGPTVSVLDARAE